MGMTKCVRGVLLAAIPLLVVTTGTAAAAVLCQKKSGAVFLRAACRKKEAVVDGATVGLQPRVTGTCGPGSALTTIGADGAVTCQQAGVFAWGHVRGDGTIRSASSNVASVTHAAAGEYCITFSNAPANADQLEGAVASLAGNASSGVAYVRVENGQTSFLCDGLAVGVTDGGGVKVNARFSFIVP